MTHSFWLPAWFAFFIILFCFCLFALCHWEWSHFVPLIRQKKQFQNIILQSMDSWCRFGNKLNQVNKLFSWLKKMILIAKVTTKLLKWLKLMKNLLLLSPGGYPYWFRLASIQCSWINAVLIHGKCALGK